MALDKAKAPPLPVPLGDVDRDYVQQLVRVLELYFSQLDSSMPNHSQKYTADYFIGGEFYGSLVQVVIPTRTVTGTVTVAADDFLLLANASGGAVTINLPAAASSEGRMLAVKKIEGSANTVTLDGDGAETIDGSATLVISTPFATFTVVCDGTTWWIE